MDSDFIWGLTPTNADDSIIYFLLKTKKWDAMTIAII